MPTSFLNKDIFQPCILTFKNNERKVFYTESFEPVNEWFIDACYEQAGEL